MIAGAMALSGCATESVQPVAVSTLMAKQHCTAQNEGVAFIGRRTDPAFTGLPENQRILRIAMGVRNTAGYGLSLLAAERQGNRLIIRINRQHPPKNAMTAQVMTSPCLFLSVPKYDYKRVDVLNQQGKMIYSLEKGQTIAAALSSER